MLVMTERLKMEPIGILKSDQFCCVNALNRNVCWQEYEGIAGLYMSNIFCHGYNNTN